MIWSVSGQGREVLRWGPSKVRRWWAGPSRIGRRRSAHRRLLDGRLRSCWGSFSILLNSTLWIDNDWLLFLLLLLLFNCFFFDLSYLFWSNYHFLGFKIGFFLDDEYFSRIFRFFVDVDDIIPENNVQVVQVHSHRFADYARFAHV